MKLVFLAAGLSLLPGLALAHTGPHGSGFLSGLVHPIGGVDHVLAMVAVGLWAAMSGGRAVWALPLGFIGAMVAGGLIGGIGISLPGVEPMILASTVALAAAAAIALRLPLGVAVGVTALFGLFHGHAHGTEGPPDGLALYAAGFVIATTALHAIGLGLGLGINRIAMRVLAAMAALAGVGLALA